MHEDNQWPFNEKALNRPAPDAPDWCKTSKQPIMDRREANGLWASDCRLSGWTFWIIRYPTAVASPTPNTTAGMHS